MPQHVGIAHVAGIKVFLLTLGQVFLDLVKRGHRKCHSNELATFLSKHALARGYDGLIGIQWSEKFLRKREELAIHGVYSSLLYFLAQFVYHEA